MTANNEETTATALVVDVVAVPAGTEDEKDDDDDDVVRGGGDDDDDEEQRLEDRSDDTNANSTDPSSVRTLSDVGVGFLILAGTKIWILDRDGWGENLRDFLSDRMQMTRIHEEGGSGFFVAVSTFAVLASLRSVALLVGASKAFRCGRTGEQQRQRQQPFCCARGSRCCCRRCCCCCTEFGALFLLLVLWSGEIVVEYFFWGEPIKLWIYAGVLAVSSVAIASLYFAAEPEAVENRHLRSRNCFWSSVWVLIGCFFLGLQVLGSSLVLVASHGYDSQYYYLTVWYILAYCGNVFVIIVAFVLRARTWRRTVHRWDDAGDSEKCVPRDWSYTDDHDSSSDSSSMEEEDGNDDESPKEIRDDDSSSCCETTSKSSVEDDGGNNSTSKNSIDDAFDDDDDDATIFDSNSVYPKDLYVHVVGSALGYPILAALDQSRGLYSILVNSLLVVLAISIFSAALFRLLFRSNNASNNASKNRQLRESESLLN